VLNSGEKQQLETYLAFAAADGEDGCDSVYLGKL
jgi:hypothetical protein